MVNAVIEELKVHDLLWGNSLSGEKSNKKQLIPPTFTTCSICLVAAAVFVVCGFYCFRWHFVTDAVVVIVNGHW